MAELFRSFDQPIRHSTGLYTARIVGRGAADGMWEGWLEFVPIAPADADVIASSVESRQPAREHLDYWAQGLTMVYAEGSLERALHPLTVRARIAEAPATDPPAPRIVAGAPRAIGPEPVLDPFEVGGRNLDILAQELGALNRPRLINIIAAYDLNSGGQDVSRMTDPQLLAFIVAAVEARLPQGIRR